MVPAAATTCPDCGYTIDWHDRWRILLGGVGTLMTLTVVFAPFGMPLVWRAHRHQRAADGTVTSRDYRAIRAHVASVLRQHLG